MTAMWPITMPTSGRRGDGAEHVVEAAALDSEPRHLPAHGAREVGDLGDDRAAVLREHDQRLALVVVRGLDRRDAGEPRQRGAHLARSGVRHLDPDGVVMARAPGEFLGRAVGYERAVGDHYGPAADGVDI